jgi:hypothetical protein
VNDETRREAGSETTVGGWWSNEILIAPDDIARGTAGDCCILCGTVGINLPDEEGCIPNVSPAEVKRGTRPSLSEVLRCPAA